MAGKVLTRRRKNKAGEYTSWEYRFQAASVDGKRQWITRAGFQTEQEAYAAGVVAYQEYQNSGVRFTPSEISVSDFMDYWLKEYCETNLKETTVLNYRKKLKNLIKPSIGKYQLSKISSITLQKMLNQLFNDGYSRNTLAVVKGILTNSFQYAKNQKFIKENPMYDVSLPRTNAVSAKPSRKRNRSFISSDDVKRIIERFPEGHPVHIPLILGYRCGLRHGEAYALQWRDIDFDAKTLTVSRQIQYREKELDIDKRSIMYFSDPKYNSIRTIQLDDMTIDLLIRTKYKQDKDKLLCEEFYVRYYEEPHTRILNITGSGEEVEFVNRYENGEVVRPRTMQHASYIIHNNLAIPTFDYHSLRHTHCTELIEAGVSPKSVQVRLGHKDIKTTLNIYEHVTQRMEEQTRDTLNQMYGSSVSTLCPLSDEK